MAGKDFTATLSVDQSPKDVFDAINNVRGWWSGDIFGSVDKVGAEFTYRYGEEHFSRQKVAELVPGKKVVWHVTDAKLSFDKTDEWVGTDIVFEITQKGNKTEVHFTHAGLVPAFQCYGDCSTAWSTLVRGNLRRLITTGKAQPDAFASNVTAGQDYTASFTVDQSPKQVFDAIKNVRGWWSEEIEGMTDTKGTEFRYHYQDVHRCTMRITELIPEKKVEWLVLDNYFNFVEDKGDEWKGTKVVFEISRKGDKTEVHFTHVGLVPQHECYSVCSNAWGSYVSGSLWKLITTGKGNPNRKEDAVSRSK
ncbi:MAG: SRPBCC family protein [Spirochaetia bacterium]